MRLIAICIPGFEFIDNSSPCLRDRKDEISKLSLLFCFVLGMVWKKKTVISDLPAVGRVAAPAL